VPADTEHYKESYALACEISNRLAREIEAKGIAILPIGNDHAYYNRLRQSDVAVLVEVDIGQYYSKVGEAIGRGVNAWAEA
jgi:hypothetical protein